MAVDPENSERGTAMSKHSVRFCVVTIILCLHAGALAAPGAAPGDPAPPADLPAFWKSTLGDVDRAVQDVSRGSVKVVATSPGGRPVYAVTYGAEDALTSQANYNSAVAARNPAFYAHKHPDTKPCVFFLGPVHGQEIENIVGLVNLLRVAETGHDHRGKSWPSLKERIAKCRIIVVPCGNPDGRARCPYDAFHGLPTEIMTKYGQGTRKDGSLWGWPGAKAVHPMQGDVGILGAYFNDDGINPMHDDFFLPMARETAAILQIAREEAAVEPGVLGVEGLVQVKGLAEALHHLGGELGVEGVHLAGLAGCQVDDEEAQDGHEEEGDRFLNHASSDEGDHGAPVSTARRIPAPRAA